MTSRVWKLAVPAMGLMLLAAACSSGGGGGGASGTPAPSGSASPTTMTIGSETTNNHGEATVSGKTSVSMEQDNFYFGPTVLTGTAGQTLSIDLTNNGTVPHTFTIDSQNIDDTLNPGESMTIQVTFPDSGFTEFHCRFHQSQGMVGELTVG